MKIDYLRLTNVRTDPITDPDGLSPHVHSYYGASEAAPSTTYEKLRAAAGNTGNVEENKSLYWHPTIYRYVDGRYEIQDTSYFSTYYIWPTGETTAFPDGLKMIGGGAGTAAQSRPEADCSNPGPCPDGDCERWNDFFPATSCDELELSMLMPSCWDGVNLDSPDHRSHMAYPKNSEADGKCPKTHPVRLPQIAVFTRIAPYAGGVHLFSDGTGHFHADYFSGWEADFLQGVLDECKNDSMFSAPTDWCEDHVSFRDEKDEDASDEELREKLEPFQPPPFDATTISDEAVDDVRSLPGDNEPVVDPTPRCREQESKKACAALRYKDTEFPLGGEFSKRKACRWTTEDDDEDEEDDHDDEHDEDEESDEDADANDRYRPTYQPTYRPTSGPDRRLRGARKARCKARDACGELKRKQDCREFGAASRCVYEGGECFFDGE